MLVADYHAPDANEECVELLKQFGVKKIIRQKEVFQPELYFQLMSITPIGDLSRMTQYKSSAEEDRTAHLLTYPVLMAHDVAGYEEVLVGEDQRQHLEFARRLLRRANRKFGLKLVIPKEKIVVGRIRDLKRPDQKMSKSQPETCLFLDDTPDEICRKIRKATPIGEGYNNLLFLYKQFVGEEVPEQNSKLKEKLSEALIEQFCRYGASGNTSLL